MSAPPASASRYLPGRTPRGPAVFLRFTRSLRELDTALERLASEAEGYERRRRRVLSLAPALLLIGLLAPLVDLVAGYGVWRFAWLLPLLWLAAALCAWSAAPEAAPRPVLLVALRRELGRVVGAWLFISLFFGAFVLALAGLRYVPWVFALIGLTLLLPGVATLFAGETRRLLPRIARDALARWWAEPHWRRPLRELRALLGALGEAHGPGALATGFVDLSGVERAEKALRLPLRLDLPAHRVFRDEWAQIELLPRGGGRLRLRLVERLDRPEAGPATLAFVDAASALAPPRGEHALLASYWPEPGSEPRPSGARPHGLWRLSLGPRRCLVELGLQGRALDLEQLSLALGALDVRLRLPAGISRRPA